MSLYRHYDPTRKVGKSQNDKQRLASKENFKLFVLASCLSQLGRLQATGEIGLTAAIYELKRAQRLAKDRQTFRIKQDKLNQKE